MYIYKWLNSNYILRVTPVSTCTEHQALHMLMVTWLQGLQAKQDMFGPNVDENPVEPLCNCPRIRCDAQTVSKNYIYTDIFPVMIVDSLTKDIGCDLSSTYGVTW